MLPSVLAFDSIDGITMLTSVLTTPLVQSVAVCSSLLSTSLVDCIAVLTSPLFLKFGSVFFRLPCKFLLERAAVFLPIALTRRSLLRSTLFQIPLSILFSLGSDSFPISLIMVSPKFIACFSFSNVLEGKWVIFFQTIILQHYRQSHSHGSGHSFPIIVQHYHQTLGQTLLFDSSSSFLRANFGSILSSPSSLTGQSLLPIGMRHLKNNHNNFSILTLLF